MTCSDEVPLQSAANDELTTDSVVAPPYCAESPWRYFDYPIAPGVPASPLSHRRCPARPFRPLQASLVLHGTAHTQACQAPPFRYPVKHHRPSSASSLVCLFVCSRVFVCRLTSSSIIASSYEKPDACTSASRSISLCTSSAHVGTLSTCKRFAYKCTCVRACVCVSAHACVSMHACACV